MNVVYYFDSIFKRSSYQIAFICTALLMNKCHMTNLLELNTHEHYKTIMYVKVYVIDLKSISMHIASVGIKILKVRSKH